MTIRSFWRTCLIVALAAWPALGAQAQTDADDNKGREFLMGFLPNFDDQVTIQVHLTADSATLVTVEYPVNTPVFTTQVAVNPGEITIVDLPVTTTTGWVANTIANNAVRAFADDEFVAYMINLRPFSSDAALALPVDVLNTDYIALTWDATVAGEFLVTAPFDGTEVTITPSNNIFGHAAGVPFVVSLDAGEGYLAQSTFTGAAGNLTGSLISANRPVAVTNGNVCTNVPQGTSFCDHVFEVAQPVQTWGGEMVVAAQPNRPQGSFYRVVGGALGEVADVLLDGTVIGSLPYGESLTIGPLIGDHVIASQDPMEVPIFVGQFMTGSQAPNAGNIGDPAMGNMIPTEQYLSDYTFSTVGGAQFAQHFLTIVAANSELDDVLFDGAQVGAASFTPIPGSAFSVARLPISDATHTTSSPQAANADDTIGHGITVQGYNQDDSYAYPGGALFNIITSTGDANPPVCDATTVAGPPPFLLGSGTDNRPTEDVNGNGDLDLGEDLNNNGQIDEDTGVFSVSLASGADNLTLTLDPFSPGDGMATYRVDLTDPASDGSGDVLIEDGSGNICTQPVSLTVEVEPLICDINENGVVDRVDIRTIVTMNGMAVKPGMTPDIDGDGVVTILDARQCVLQCTLPNCEIPK
ncbi:MAG: hypothetical protein AB8G17_10730 [Gammaproteobacteria bacterium]